MPTSYNNDADGRVGRATRILEIISAITHGVEFTTEDLWVLLNRNGIEFPRVGRMEEKQGLWPVIGRAIRAGIITRGKRYALDEYEPSLRKNGSVRRRRLTKYRRTDKDWVIPQRVRSELDKELNQGRESW